MDVKEVKEVEEAQAIARRSFLLTFLARIAVYSAAATETNPKRDSSRETGAQNDCAVLAGRKAFGPRKGVRLEKKK